MAYLEVDALFWRAVAPKDASIIPVCLYFLSIGLLFYYPFTEQMRYRPPRLDRHTFLTTECRIILWLIGPAGTISAYFGRTP